MLGNPNYALSLTLAFGLGFVGVMAMPFRAPVQPRLVAVEKAAAADNPFRQKLISPASVVHTASIVPVRSRPFRPAREPARQVSIASLLERDDVRAFASYIEPSYSKWSSPTRTRLVALASAPFPYNGTVPRSRRPFLNYRDGNRVGRKTRSGRVYWADKNYSDNRVLLHIPRGFDPDRPSVMVLFFHGHGATLARDVVARQQLPAQISGSGINSVLVAPQFAVDARDSSAGNFWNPGGTRRFLDEAARQLARLAGDPDTESIFRNMPVVIVGYSGGYVPTAATLAHGRLGERIKGVVLLDGLYGEFDKFARWIERTRSGFFLSAYAMSTRKGNAALMNILKKRGVDYSTRLQQSLGPGSVTFVKAVDSHRNYVTKAWARNPVSDLLSRITWTAPQLGPTRSAALSASISN
jgi:hypothetical protein